jgi:hypothetical protein
MRRSQPRAFAMAALFALALAACSGGGGITSQPQSGMQPVVAGPGSNPTADVMTLAPSGATHSLKLPQGYSGEMSVGPNSAPAGTNMQITLAAGMGGANSRTMVAAPPADPFPIVFTIRLPITITLPFPSFTLCLPRSVTVSGQFDVSIFDPTQPISPPLNPVVLGQAVITPAPVSPPPHGCAGPTLAFTAVPGTTFRFVRNVSYPLTIARNASGDYAGGASNVVLPVQSNTNQNLAPIGPFGAGVTYNTSSTSGFLQWTNINGGPSGISPLIYNDDPIQSLVVTATQALSLNSIQVSVSFATSSSASLARHRAVMSRDDVASTPPPVGTFIPDPTLPAYGPFPATVSGNQATFTVTPDAPLSLGGTKAWDFSLVTVTACVPINVSAPCDSPTSTNVQTTVPLGQQFDFLVSDASGLLTGHYSATGSGACSTDGINQDDNNGDNPPGYNDNTTGPNSELEANASGTAGTCDIVVSYNGSPVAETTVAVGGALDRLVFKRNTLRPPVNGPKGYAIPGHGATPAP